jgi:hypothetical protein
MIVGQNPGGLDGTPVTISWFPVDEYNLPIDRYEIAREGNRRPFGNLRMDRINRDFMLRNLGFSVKERWEGERIAAGIRRQRQESIANANLDAYYEKMERMTRLLKNVATFGRRKAKERRYLRNTYHSGVPIQNDSSAIFSGNSSQQPHSVLKRYATS